MSIKNIVTEYQADSVLSHEISTDDEGLGNAFGTRLLCVSE